jgi:hypothetical protein
MAGQAHWITGMVLLLGALLVVGLPLLLARYQANFRGVRRDLICPKSKNVARVELVQFVPTQQFTGVFSCSEFEDPTRVRCTKNCVGEANRRR